MCDTLKNANQKNATGTVGRKPVWHIEKCHLRMSLLDWHLEDSCLEGLHLKEWLIMNVTQQNDS
jgi:hypothetical protein